MSWRTEPAGGRSGECAGGCVAGGRFAFVERELEGCGVADGYLFWVVCVHCLEEMKQVCGIVGVV